METLKTLEEQVDDLKKQLWNLQTKIIPALQSNTGGNSSSGEEQTSSSEQWQTIYDMESADETLNFGNTTGICFSSGIVDFLPDLTPYNFLRVHIRINSTCHSCHILNIGESRDSLFADKKTVKTHLCITGTYLINNVVITNVSIGVDDDGKRYINMGASKMISFTANKYPAITTINTSNNTYYIIEKIEAMI